MPLQGGGIPEDSLDQVFRYGYTTVDDGDLSAEVLPTCTFTHHCKINGSRLNLRKLANLPYIVQVMCS